MACQHGNDVLMLMVAQSIRFECLFLAAPNGHAVPSGECLQLRAKRTLHGLAERIARSRAARYAMLCEPMTGSVAGQLGIASFVVPESEVEAAALKFAQDLSTGPTRSYAAIRA